jgi:hypothetical protein
MQAVKVQQVQQDQQDQLVQQVPHRQFQVQQDLQVPLEPQDQLDHKVIEDQLDRQALKVILDQQEPIQQFQVQLDLQDQLAPLRQSLDLQDPQDQPVQTVQQDLQVQLDQQALHIH